MFFFRFRFNFVFFPSVLFNLKSKVDRQVSFAFQDYSSTATLGWLRYFLMQGTANDLATRRAIRRDRERAKEAELPIGKGKSNKTKKKKKGKGEKKVKNARR